MKHTIDVIAYLGGLFVGIVMLLFFFFLVLQAIVPAMKRRKQEREIKIFNAQLEEVFDEVI